MESAQQNQQIESTLGAAFFAAANRYGDRVALRHKVGKEYADIRYRELAERVIRLAAGLARLGIERGDRVALLSENRPEWAVTDLAVLSLGGIIVPLYTSLPAAQVEYAVRDSWAKALVVSDAGQLKKGLEVRANLPGLQTLIVMDSEAAPTGDADDDGVHTLESVSDLGQAQPLDDYAARQQAVQPDDVASVVYTSGTTGDPKGAMLTHGNFTWELQAIREHFRVGGAPIGEEDVFLSFLPLSHTFERLAGHFLPLAIGASIGYSEGIRTLADDMARLQPTIMVCVPRVFESFHERMLDAVAKQPASNRAVFEKAVEFGYRYAEAKREGHVGALMAAQHAMYEKLVFSNLCKRFGGRLRFLVSGGAALSKDTAAFFEALGLPILEGYGLTESSPVICVNPYVGNRIGTVGTTLPGAETRIAPDGEVIYRGPNVMKGYWNNPTATAEMIDADGWLHTGDIGALDSGGYLRITDRKKDIIVLANGKNVAPQPIEGMIKRSPLVSEIVLIGDKQSIVTALVLPNKDKLRACLKESGTAVPDSDSEMLALPEARKKIKQEIDDQSKTLADFERIRRFTLLPDTFSIETGEMTPTLKIKRKVVLQKYAREVAEMRGGGESGGS
jgi:long-chain acyl-CoA synthetase